MQTLPIYLLIDTSSSMGEHGKDKSASEALRYAVDAMRTRAMLTNTQCLVRMIQFDDIIRSSDFQLLDDFKVPQLRVGGNTNIVKALRQIVTDLETDLSDGSYFLPPLIVMITDGYHVNWNVLDERKEMSEYLDYFLTLEPIKQAIRVAIAIGETVDRETLTRFSSDGIPVLYANNAENLTSFIKWTANAIGAGVMGLLAAPQPEVTPSKDW